MKRGFRVLKYLQLYHTFIQFLFFSGWWNHRYDTRRLMCCLVTTWCSQSSCNETQTWSSAVEVQSIWQVLAGDPRIDALLNTNKTVKWHMNFMNLRFWCNSTSLFLNHDPKDLLSQTLRWLGKQRRGRAGHSVVLHKSPGSTGEVFWWQVFARSHDAW